MMVWVLVAAIGGVFAGGLAELFLPRLYLGRLAQIMASLVFFWEGNAVLAKKTLLAASGSWQVPNAAFHVVADGLSSWFLMALAASCLFFPLFFPRPRPGEIFWQNSVLAATSLSLVAANGFLFLMSWELGSLAAFFFFTKSLEKKVSPLPFLFLSHFSTLSLLAFLGVTGRFSQTLEFSEITLAGAPGFVVYGLGLAGFGARAGLFPLPRWTEIFSGPNLTSRWLMFPAMALPGAYGLARFWLAPGSAGPWGWMLLVAGGCALALAAIFDEEKEEGKMAFLGGTTAVGIGFAVLMRQNDPGLAALSLASSLAIALVGGFAMAFGESPGGRSFPALAGRLAWALVLAWPCGMLAEAGLRALSNAESAVALAAVFCLFPLAVVLGLAARLLVSQRPGIPEAGWAAFAFLFSGPGVTLGAQEASAWILGEKGLGWPQVFVFLPLAAMPFLSAKRASFFDAVRATPFLPFGLELKIQEYGPPRRFWKKSPHFLQRPPW